MQETLENFLRALRAADLPISPVEAIDAHRAVAAIGYGDRVLLKDTLCIALAKTADEVRRFDDCFEMFFSRDQFRDRTAETADDDPLLADQPLAQMLLGGSEAELAQAMEQAAADAGIANIQYATQRGLYVRRLLEGMGLRDMEAFIATLPAEDAASAALAARLEEGRRYLFDEARRYIARQYELYASANGERLREEFLVETALSAVERRDFERMHRLVRRMARRLATRYDRRRKHTNRGVLNVRRTIRRNMAHDGIPFETEWKQTKIERPKIMVICDVSQSVAAAARFLLLFLYSLNEVIASLRAFAFSSHLVEVSETLERETVEKAIPDILETIGFRPTDYGRSLADFDDGFMDAVDRKTTVIILGDGRSNTTDPRIDLMRRLHDRSKAVICLNPEPENFWG
ncbi:MAG: VWA domain-containing protein, partial [Alphaproteobacteria bacterium]|nr:VWA domain-containing protein [Alphaproteobacteria bacterium]